MTRTAIYLARNIRLDSMPEYQAERDLIKREARAILDKTLEMGDGDAALGTVRAFAAGVLDIPWSPNRHVQSRVMPARDADGYLRIVDPGFMPYPKDVMEIHEQRLRQRAQHEQVPFGHELAVSSVYELAEPIAKLLPDKLSMD
jgi:methylaspartate mutase epsilon subunit